MQVLKTDVFQGPNRWSRAPVLETHIEFSASVDRLPSELAALVVELHQLAGVVTKPIPTASTDSPGVHILPFEFEEESLIRECLETAIRLCRETPRPASIDIQPERRRLEDLADDVRLGPSSRAILRAATARGIPFRRLNQGSLVQLGEGAFQRRIWTAETDATSAIAESIASDKQLTRSMLNAVGVNVPQGRSVVDRDDAWRAAEEIGLPVVVKPRNGNHANGVSLDLGDRDAVLAAYDWACKQGTTSDVLVEQYIVGEHHRLLVVGSRMVAAARGQREYVIGDGLRTVESLIHELNSDPRRGENYTDLLDTVRLSESTAIALSKQGLAFDSIPERDRSVLVRYVGDLIEDCTDQVHPTTSQVAVLAAKTIGLDITGMDLVVQDISRPLSEQRGCIIEVNAGPSLSPHVAPLIGSPQPVGEAIIDLLFPMERSAKIPTILIVRDADECVSIESLVSALEQLGNTVGAASEFTSNGPRDAWSLSMHPFLTAMILECSANSVANDGLACSHAEFTILPAEFFQSGPERARSMARQATLKTLGFLLSESGLLLVVGDENLDTRTVARQSGVPSSRVLCLPTGESATSVICEHLQSDSLETQPC